MLCNFYFFYDHKICLVDFCYAEEIFAANTILSKHSTISPAALVFTAHFSALAHSYDGIRGDYGACLSYPLLNSYLYVTALLSHSSRSLLRSTPIQNFLLMTLYRKLIMSSSEDHGFIYCMQLGHYFKCSFSYAYRVIGFLNRIFQISWLCTKFGEPAVFDCFCRLQLRFKSNFYKRVSKKTDAGYNCHYRSFLGNLMKRSCWRSLASFPLRCVAVLSTKSLCT